MNKDRSFFRADSNEKQKKILKKSLLLILIIFILTLIIFFTNFLLNIDKTATIKILVAPSDATIIIDSKPYKTNETIKLRPGNYAVEIKKDDFISFKGEIEAKDKEITYLYEFLNEKDKNGTFYKNNEKEAGIAQQISDFKADNFRQGYTDDDPIWSITPYDNYKKGYKITSDKEDKKIIITIYSYSCSKKEIKDLEKKARKYLTDRDINLKNYEINYSSC